MEQTLQFDYILKFILVGDSSVGKSTLLSMFVQSRFNKDSNPTMGVEFATKKVHLAGKVIKLQVWDTAGQQSFRTITRAYYKNAIGVVLVYDLTAPNTIDSLESWLSEIQDNSNEKAEIIIIGNKHDLQAADGSSSKSSTKLDYPHFITSAKTGENVEKAFLYLAEKVLGKIRTGQISADGTHGVKKGNASKGSIRLEQKDDQDQGESDKPMCC